MKKLWVLAIFILSLFVIGGCGKGENDEQDTASDSNAQEETSETEQEEQAAEEEEEEPKEEETAPSEDSSFSDLIAYMEEETEGIANVMYENTEPQEHELDGVTVSLDGYTLVELTDFHADFSIPFNDETDGGVIIAQYTVTNSLDKDVYYMPSFYLNFTGADKAYYHYQYLIPEEEQITEKLSPSNDYLLKAGESVTGYIAYPFGKTHLEALLEVSTAIVEVPAAQEKKGEFGNPIGKDGQFTLSLNEAGEEKVAANSAFYEDKVTTDDMGEKIMLKEEDNIGKEEKIRDVTVTLDGYQFTEFIPNEIEAPRFEDFQNGIVLLTVKFLLDNQGEEDISLSSVSTKLTVNDGMQYMFDQAMLLNYSYDDVIKAGESGELLQIYTLDKEQYDKIWKDKSFLIEIGPFRNQDGEDISKGASAEFEL